MADRETWAQRVAEWRASGESARAFCVGRDFSAGGLRNAAHQIDQAVRARAALVAVPTARVVRVAAPEAGPARAPALAAAESPILLEAFGVRVAVSRGFDRATLAGVLDVLATRGGAS